MKWVKSSERLPKYIHEIYFAIDSNGNKGTAVLGNPDIFYDGKKRTWLWEGSIYKDDVAEWLDESN